MKKSLALLAAFVIASGYQSLSGETSGDWTYMVTNNQATITGYSGDDTEVVIPAEMDGLAVVKVEGGSYKSIFDPSSSSVTSVTIPDSVTSIGNDAFNYCTSLTSINIPDSVTSIGESAFISCISLLSITIPDSVTSIGNDAFNYCTSLTSINIPDSVTSIGQRVFYYCPSLNNVTIGNSVTSIGVAAFYGCSSLLSITIPDSVESIRGYTFYDCTSLTNITIGKSVTSIGESAFIYCSSLTSITIPDSVTSIGIGAFNGCTSLISVTLPGTLFMEGNYSSYSLSADQVRVEKTSIDTFVVTAETAAHTAGQTDVTSDPTTYSLYTASDVTSAEATARALEKSDIINNPTIHGLFGENTVEDVRIGVPMMRKNSEGKLLFNFQIQASDDLKNWTTLDSPEYEVIPSSDKEFLRVRVSNEQFK